MTNDSKYFRLLMTQTKGLPLTKDEIWGFSRLTKEQTGLNCEVFVDDDRTFESYKHELWLYADFDGFKIPVTISERPSAKRFANMNKYDLSEVARFIVNNRTFLTEYSHGNIDKDTFFTFLDAFRRDGILLENRDYTMNSTLSPRKTGLPCPIWVDEDKTYLPHAPRIKFRADRSNRTTRKDPSMEIKNPDRIHNLPKHVDLTEKEIDKIKEFVRKHEKSLLMVSNKEMTLAEFVETLSNSDNEIKYDVLDSVYGISLCRREDGKYNYVTKEGKLLLNDFVDKATSFMLFDDDILIAQVTDKGRQYYINERGEEIRL